MIKCHIPSSLHKGTTLYTLSSTWLLALGHVPGPRSPSEVRPSSLPVTNCTEVPCPHTPASTTPCCLMDSRWLLMFPCYTQSFRDSLAQVSSHSLPIQERPTGQDCAPVRLVHTDRFLSTQLLKNIVGRFDDRCTTINVIKFIELKKYIVRGQQRGGEILNECVWC